MFCKRIIPIAVLLCGLTGVCAGADAIGRERLSDLCGRLGLSDPAENGGKVHVGGGANTEFVFSEGSRKLLVDRALVWMNGPLLKDGSGWTVSRADAATVIEPLLNLGGKAASPGAPMVVIDPGHGGKDTGAVGRNGVMEKRVALEIAAKVRQKLKSAGVDAKLSRKRDSTLSLAERTARAKKWGANFFVSVHLNCSANTNASGIETYVLPSAGFSSTSGETCSSNACAGNAFDGASAALAYRIQVGILSAVPETEDRGIRRARFDVLREAPCAAALVECGFVSNEKDAARLQREEYIESVAEGIARGILDCAGPGKEKEKNTVDIVRGS